MKNILIFLLVLLFSTNNAYAQEKKIIDPPPLVQGEVDVGQAISPIRKNQLAPFTGVLLAPAAVAKILTELNSIAATVELESSKVKQEENAKCVYKVQDAIIPLRTDIKILNISNDEKKKRIDVLNETIKEQSKNQSNTPTWVAVGTGAGFILGALTTVLISYSVTQSSK
jgi:hypothetical protein